MAKRITVGEAEIAELRADFEKKLSTIKAADGKFKFEKDLGTVNKKAKLLFDEETFLKMKLLIATCDKEVGWHCLARKVKPDEGYDGQYEVYGIMVYPQEVTGTTVKTNKEEFDAWLYDRPDEEFSNLRFHGHSHVNMSTTPSGVDKTMYEDWLDDLAQGIPNQFYIFSIWNKKGEHWVNIYDLDENVLYETKDVDVKYLCDDDGVMDFVSGAMDMLKTYKKPATNTSQSLTPPKTNGVTYMNSNGYPSYDDDYYYSNRYGAGIYYPAKNYPDWDD